MALAPSPLEAFRRTIGRNLRTGLSSAFDASPARAPVAAARALREACRSGAFAEPTAGFAPGCVQANLVAVPRSVAFDFARFCLLNPRPCPVVAISADGSVGPRGDLRRDLPRYLVWRDGAVAAEVLDVGDVWDDDMVGFLLGCSFSWEGRLEAAGLTPRHVEAKTNVPMYVTDVPNEPSGPFGGTLVVSMRPYAPRDVPRVDAVTAAFPAAHGAPVHWGAPEALGIADLAAPDFGDAVDIREGEVPVFWACGVTPQTALAAAKLPLAVTHAPGHMFVFDDVLDEDLRAG